MATYREYSKLDLPALDAEVLRRWSEHKIFERSVSERPADQPWVFYEGPPSANGKPGIHHVMARTVKDLFCRYHTMLGKRVERKGGWDTHGLPVELKVEKELGITKDDIGDSISVEEYNRKCRETVMRFKEEWDDLTVKMGYWVDLDNPYVTFEREYMATVWWLLKQLYDKDMLYKGYTIQPYSPAAGTGLSSHELNMPGAYQEVKDTSAVALFKLHEDHRALWPTQLQDRGTIYVSAWTTTPWTLPSNTGLTVGPRINYVLVRTNNPYTDEEQQIVIAADLVGKWFGGHNQPEVLEQSEPFTGNELVGLRYEQLFDFGNPIEPIGEGTEAFKIIPGDFVTTADGTGIVHTAPSFGADDRRAGMSAGLGALTLVDEQGRFKSTVGPFSNRYIKDYRNDPDFKNVDIDISVELKKRGQALNVAKYSHNYPHCWRTDKPILYYPLDSWFIKASSVKERMMELNDTINWKPKSTGSGRFGKWLENLQDWNLSRSRYWGIPLPIWRSADGAEEICIGGLDDLQQHIDLANRELNLNQTLPEDLHRPYIDEIKLWKNGKELTRETDLIDVWFDSGSMPYAQHGYPFKNQEEFRRNYPADFIAEGVDQTRGWFYTLHAIATMVFDSVAFKNVVSNGLVLDKNGQKMSKRLGNAVDPFETLSTYGADATRWYMMTNAAPWDNLKFDSAGIGEVQRKFFGTLYNTYGFFALYANVDEWSASDASAPQRLPYTEIDRWLKSKLNTLLQEVRARYEDFDPTAAGRLIQDFVTDQLSNWYVRLNRKRFWRGELTEDKLAAYQTLHEALVVVSQLMAPIAPFYTEQLYRDLTAGMEEAADSVHLSILPEVDSAALNPKLEERMEFAQRIVSLGFSLRKKENIRVRQPLAKMLVPVLDPAQISQIKQVADLIKQELNVKEIEYVGGDALSKTIKPNFRVLGKKVGKQMKEAARIIGTMDAAAIQTIEQLGSYSIELGGQPYELEREDVEITTKDIPGWTIASDGTLTVALDLTINDELRAEGLARELVNRIQNLRKDAGLEVTDRIRVQVSPNDQVQEAVDGFGDYIRTETLADELTLTAVNGTSTPIDLGEDVGEVGIQIARA